MQYLFAYEVLMRFEVKRINGNRIELMNVSSREYFEANNFQNLDLREGDIVDVYNDRMHRINR